MTRRRKERLRTFAAVIALIASSVTLLIAAGNWSGYLDDDALIYALVLMSVAGMPASIYLLISYWRERRARKLIVIEAASSAQIVPLRELKRSPRHAN
jgi:hypothetical protein